MADRTHDRAIPFAAVPPLVHPEVVVLPVGAETLGQARAFAEAQYQVQPLVTDGTPVVASVARFLRSGTALPRGITAETATRYATTGRRLESLIRGAHPTGKTAEVIVAAEFRSGAEAGDPSATGPMIADVRLSPDPSSYHDLLFGMERADGQLVWRGGGQVKTGAPPYVSSSLVEMAASPEYGRVAYVDARYVAVDGGPRVADDAFTTGQACRLREAGIELRGIRNLDERARALKDNITRAATDGLDPRARAELQQLREDIAAAYRPGSIAARVVGGAVAAAAAAAVVSLVVQLASDGTLDAQAVGHAVRTGALSGAAGVTLDAGLFHAALDSGMTPELAKQFAQHGVTLGFVLVAVGSDAIVEFKSLREKKITAPDAVAGVAFKAALDLLPLVLMPLGLLAVPIIVASQLGGRWALTRFRSRDRRLTETIATDLTVADNLKVRAAAVSGTATTLIAESEVVTDLFAAVMRENGRPSLRLVPGHNYG